MIDWLELAVQRRKKYDEIMDTPLEQYIFWCLQVWGTPYGWGKETLWSSDCSGLVCSGLAGMGYRIRTNADGLFRKVFTIVGDDKCNEVKAIFFYDPSQQRAIHVGAIVGDGVVLHAPSEAAKIEQLDAVISWYGSMGYQPHVRQLDFAQAGLVSDSGEEFWGADAEFKRLFFGEE